MKKRIPRVAAIHDMSCFGRCALTVIIPTLSAMGIQTIPVPTALLSTHTGGFSDMTFLDLHGEMQGISRHFEELGIKFDAIYTGFLGSDAQIETVSEFISKFGSDDCLIFVDPVMGDDGELYSTYTQELMLGMRQLCHAAHVITPNLTEACFLTGTDYPDLKNASDTEAETFTRELCLKLWNDYRTDVVLTGVSYGNGKIATGTLKKGEFKIHLSEHVGRNYPGTGDLFASVMLGRLLGGNDIFDSAVAASDFTRDVIAFSEEYGEPVRDGVVLEPMLMQLRP